MRRLLDALLVKFGPSPIRESETFARFIFSGGQIKASGEIKPGAFMPAKNLETSVFRKARMPQSRYADYKSKIAALREKALVGVAIIDFPSIKKARLKVEPEESDHRWHANILGWPDAKHEQKHLAQLLAKSAARE